MTKELCLQAEIPLRARDAEREVIFWLKSQRYKAFSDKWDNNQMHQEEGVKRKKRYKNSSMKY